MRVSECFYSLQGEGRHMGMAAFFVRLAGCDVGCAWCDSREARGGGEEVSESDIVHLAAASRAETVVITGGEPLMQNLGNLCTELHSHGLRVHLETSGTHPLSGDFEWVTLSPKRHRPPLFWGANELKVVIAAPEDFAWAEQCAARVPSNCLLYLQPAWGLGMEREIVEYIKKNPHWRLSVQVHKYLDIP